MKKTNLSWAFVLLVICLSSCSSKPKDAKECIMQFLEYLKEGNAKKGDDISSDNYWDWRKELEKYSQDTNRTSTVFNIAQKYNPQWEPETFIQSEDIDEVWDNDLSRLEKIHGRYNNKDVVFYVYFDKHYYDRKNKEYLLYDFEGFLKMDSIITINGIKVKKGTNCADIHFLAYSDIKGVVSCVNEFNKSVKNRKPSYKLFPNAKGFGNSIIIDSIASVIQSVTINLTKDLSLKNYKVECSGGKIFYVEADSYDYDSETYSYIIKNSIGLYNYEKKILDICTKYDYEYELSDKPKTDVDAWKLAKSILEKAKAEEKRRIEEEKKRKEEEERRAYQQNRVNYYKKIGLVIKEIRMVSGKDKDGDPTKGIKINVFNPTNKTIKYLIIYVAAVNRVNDVMGRKTCRGIGPIEPRGGGSYDFDDLFYDYNDIIDDISASVELVYTDGTRKTVKWKDAMSTGGFDEDWWYDY